jgi:hypothetical protein
LKKIGKKNDKKKQRKEEVKFKNMAKKEKTSSKKRKIRI